MQHTVVWEIPARAHPECKWPLKYFYWNTVVVGSADAVIAWVLAVVGPALVVGTGPALGFPGIAVALGAALVRAGASGAAVAPVLGTAPGAAVAPAVGSAPVAGWPPSALIGALDAQLTA